MPKINNLSQNSKALVEAALKVSEEYEVSVFPVGLSKVSIPSKAEATERGWVDERGRAGRYLASRDAARITEMFSHPDARGIGVPTGARE